MVVMVSLCVVVVVVVAVVVVVGGDGGGGWVDVVVVAVVVVAVTFVERRAWLERGGVGKHGTSGGWFPALRGLKFKCRWLAKCRWLGQMVVAWAEHTASGQPGPPP